MGVTTISMSVQPHITATVGVPRGIFLRFPAGNQVGEAGKPVQQRAILTAALESAYSIESPGTVLELPFRWRRFPIEEEPVFPGKSSGPRHRQAEVIGVTLDTMVRQAREYLAWLEGRLIQEEASPTPIKGLAQAFRAQAGRVDQLIEVLDTSTLDQYREMVNSIATLELRASGRFV
jgi:D-proline reductase (dithiol) PrdB